MSNTDVTPDHPAPAEPNPATAETASGATPADLAGPLEAARKERDEAHERYLRSVADLENYRRRVIREKDELRQFANKDLLEAIFPVYENLVLATASARQATDPQAIATGVSFVLDQFRTTLAAKGLVEINPTPGAAFDPHQHESISHLPSATVPEEAILQVARIGFSLNSRVIRPASVVLSSGPAQPAAG